VRILGWWKTNTDIYNAVLAMHLDMNVQLSEIKEELRFVRFRFTKPESFTIVEVTQEEVFIMGTTVDVFGYEIQLAAVPENNDAVEQKVDLTGIFKDAENTSVIDTIVGLGREPQTLSIKAMEDETVSVSLRYVDANSNVSEPEVVEFTVEDGIAPEVPIDAMTITQTMQETVELPDEEDSDTL